MRKYGHLYFQSLVTCLQNTMTRDFVILNLFIGQFDISFYQQIIKPTIYTCKKMELKWSYRFPPKSNNVINVQVSQLQMGKHKIQIFETSPGYYLPFILLQRVLGFDGCHVASVSCNLNQ